MDCFSPNLLCYPPSPWYHPHHHRQHHQQQQQHSSSSSSSNHRRNSAGWVRATSSPLIESMRTCRMCKKQFRPSENHPRACFHHTAHFGGETKRKFESVHTGGTLDTPGGGEISSYWHCCGNEDPFHPGCVAGPHSSYDD